MIGLSTGSMGRGRPVLATMTADRLAHPPRTNSRNRIPNWAVAWHGRTRLKLDLEPVPFPACGAFGGISSALPGRWDKGMQPGIVALRGALIAAWEDDLRAVRQDSFDLGRGRESLVFIQRLYGLIKGLRPQIQGAWGPGGHVHVVDSTEVGGPGPRVSQSR